ncbi:MAG TPA: type II toxin-antitoxin system HicB family antitoxin [Tepidisphaeraceae bacterium]|nr:type II toxin-antitoxin system HicB family antitoxin [Tepidisphaeraceae bacterium]
MAKRYTVCDGKLVDYLEGAKEGGYVVTSPMEPALVTEGETISEAFFMARDALKTIAQSRVKMQKQWRQFPKTRSQ